MSGYVLFQMYSRRRAELIEKYEFYIQQARQRLLPQFEEEDIRNEANAAGEKFLEKHQHLFNPDRHDGSEFQEMAYDALVERYELLTEMRDNVRLSIAAGLFHEWEKNLRQWLVGEIQHWHFGKELQKMIWKKSFADVIDLLESCGWKVRDSAFFRDLDACRLVVNAYKHGNGPSLSELIGTYPEFYSDPYGDLRVGPQSAWSHASYEYLKVTDEDLNAFSKAVSAFWRDIPENIFDTQIENIPDWFVKAYEKDQDDKVPKS